MNNTSMQTPSASTATAQQWPRQWKKPAFIESSNIRRLIWVLTIVYLILSLGSLEINWARISQGLERGWAFVQGFLQPDFFSRSDDIWIGFKESITMTITSTALGVLPPVSD